MAKTEVQPEHDNGTPPPAQFTPGLAVARTMPLTQPARFQFDNEQLALMKRTVARGADDNAFLLFLELVGRYRLDPFAGQVYLAKMPGKDGEPPSYKTIVARDGLLVIANRYPEFGGMEGDVIYATDKIARTEDGFVHTYAEIEAEKRMAQEIIGAWCRVFREGRKPTFFLAKHSSYKRSNKSWQQYPDAMILKCFDAETEVLTVAGFKRFDKVSEPILAVGDGLEPVAAKPFWQPYEGPMVAFDSRDGDFCVTPSHEMITTTGRMTAWELLADTTKAPKHRLARTVQTSALGMNISDRALRLAGYYLADGYDHAQSPGRFEIQVSRERKVESLDALGLHHRRRINEHASTSILEGRTITATLPRVAFAYKRDLLPSFVHSNKQVAIADLLALSQRQARVLLDAWVEFDGRNGHLQIYTSREDHLAVFETLAVLAGLSVGPRKITAHNTSGPCYSLTASERPDTMVRRPRLGEQPSDGRGVWCVTVPSHTIVVRRRGFSMICGQCAESMALRKAFSITGLIPEDEVGARYDPDLGGVVEQEPVSQEPDWGPDPELARRLQTAFAEANRVRPGAFLPQKIRLTLAGVDQLRRTEILQQVVDFVLRNGGSIPIEGEVVKESA